MLPFFSEVESLPELDLVAIFVESGEFGLFNYIIELYRFYIKYYGRKNEMCSVE